jgi:hypothetical protein
MSGGPGTSPGRLTTRRHPKGASGGRGRIATRPLAVAAAIPSHEIRLGAPGQDVSIGEARIGGIQGPTYDGQVLSFWTTKPGSEEPDAEGKFARDVTLGEGTPVPGQPVVGTLRHVWEECRTGIVEPLKNLLGS